MIDFKQLKEQLKARLALPLPGFDAQKNMLPISRRTERILFNENAKTSGVLLLLFPHQDHIHTMLIARTKDGGAHSGQIAFPGGKKEKYDKDVVATALREANEEVCINLDEITLLGQLSSLYIPVSNFIVHPIVCVTDALPKVFPAEREVSRIILAPLFDIFNAKSEREVTSAVVDSQTWRSPTYELSCGAYIWGATAMILSELEFILKEINYS